LMIYMQKMEFMKVYKQMKMYKDIWQLSFYVTVEWYP
jgi:hypothetical protein